MLGILFAGAALANVPPSVIIIAFCSLTPIAIAESTMKPTAVERCSEYPLKAAYVLILRQFQGKIFDDSLVYGENILDECDIPMREYQKHIHLSACKTAYLSKYYTLKMPQIGTSW